MSFNLKSIIPTHSINISICYPYFSSNNIIYSLINNIDKENQKYKFLIELDHNILHININNNKLYISTTERFYILNLEGKIITTLKIKSLRSYIKKIENIEYIFICTINRLDIYNLNYNRMRFILISRIEAKNIKFLKLKNNKLFYIEELKLKSYCLKKHEIKNILYSKSNILELNIKENQILVFNEFQIIKKEKDSLEFENLNLNENNEKIIKIILISDILYSFIYENSIKFKEFNEKKGSFEEIFNKEFDEKIININFNKLDGSIFILLENKIVLLTKELNQIIELYLPKLNTFDTFNNQILIGSENKLFLYENNSQLFVYKPDLPNEIFRVFIINSILFSICRSGMVNLFDIKNKISFRQFQIELPIEDIEKHDDLLICYSIDKISIYDSYGKLLICFELKNEKKVKIQKILSYKNFIYILTYYSIERYDLITSNKISLDIKGITFDINDDSIIISQKNEITILDYNLEFIKSFKYELEGRRRDEKFYNLKLATSISYMNNLVFLSGNCNQLKIYNERFLLNTLLLSRNKDLEGYKKLLGKEKDLNIPINKSDVIKCIKLQKNLKINEIILQTQHDIRIFGLNELKYEPIELIENLNLEDINKLINTNNLQKALIGSLMLNDIQTIKRVVYKLYNSEKVEIENIVMNLSDRFITILENFLNLELFNSDDFNPNYGLLVFIKEVIKRTNNKGRIEIWEKKLREFYLKTKKIRIMNPSKI